jgi:hypothetical protein
MEPEQVLEEPKSELTPDLVPNIVAIVALRMYVCEDGHLHVPRTPLKCVGKKPKSSIILP